MQNRYSISCIILSVVLFFTVAYGQDKTPAEPAVQEKAVKTDLQKVDELKKEEPKKEEPKKMELTVPLGLSGQMFFQMKVDTLKDGDEGTTFALTRGQLNYERTIWGPISIKISSDVSTDLKSSGSNDIQDSSANPPTENSIKVGSESYAFYMKNAYIQVAHDWGFLGLKVQGGIIPTPSIAIIDKMMDLRWVYQNYSFDKPEDINVDGDDTSNDVGVGLTTTIFKYVVLNYTLCHGEGYKHPVETYDGKSHYGTITIIPYKWIYINGYINYEKTDPHTEYFYYGGGLAFVSDFLKVGGNYVLHGNKVSDESAQTYNLIETWVHFNLGPLVSQAPVLLVGRYAYGFKNSDPGNPTHLLAGGVGYEFNKYFRVLAYYESYKPEHSAGNAAFYIKTEAKF
jgi:hypothetical protein